VDAGDFKLLSRRAVEQLLRLAERDPYLRGLVVWLGFKQAFVSYERDARHAGRTHFPFFSRNPWKTFVLGMTSFSFMPIYVSAGIAVAGLLGAFILFAAAAAMLAGGSSAAAATAVAAFVVFLWATTIGIVSIVGLYIVRVYKDVRGRPQYIVASTVGLSSQPVAVPETLEAERVR
jgi:dolichol-phosphate mannosyltransferase